jgi:hypothetical protein
MTGLSTDIGASFAKPAGKPGDVLHAKAVLTAMGETLSGLSFQLNDAEGRQGGPWPLRGLTLPMQRESWLLMDVSKGARQPCPFLKDNALTDHTKYIGKSLDHPVSQGFFSSFSTPCRRIPLQKNVKFSNDGSQVLEGDDILYVERALLNLRV